jgi:hypothetical protein
MPVLDGIEIFDGLRNSNERRQRSGLFATSGKQEKEEEKSPTPSPSGRG